LLDSQGQRPRLTAPATRRPTFKDLAELAAVTGASAGNLSLNSAQLLQKISLHFQQLLSPGTSGEPAINSVTNVPPMYQTTVQAKTCQAGLVKNLNGPLEPSPLYALPELCTLA
jgi:hypothetical protein